MATCDLGYEHEDPAPAESEQAPVIIEPGPNENDVKIAEIQAEESIETAKIYASENDADLRAEVERLRGEVTGMRVVLDRVAPPEPEPVLEPEPEPAEPPVIITDGGEETPPPPETDSAPAKSGSGGGWWSGYR